MHRAALLPVTVIGAVACVDRLSYVSLQAFELSKLQQGSTDGVIELDSAAFDKFTTGRRRSYQLVVFLTAKHLLDNAKLHLRELREDYGFMAKAHRERFGGSDSEGKLFFAELNFEKSTQEVFRRLNAQTLFFFRLPATLPVTPGETIKLKEQDMLKPETFPKQPVTVDDMVNFVREKTGIDIGKVEKPTMFQSWWFPFAALLSLSSLAYMAYKILYADFMKNMVFYALATLFVYWFSVSGGMHNIIRGMPMVTIDPNTKLPKYFMPGQGQLGTEGFVMGSLYTCVGLAFALVVYIAPKAKAASTQRLIAYGGLITAFICVNQVVGVYTWKTGYHWRKYI